MNINKHKGAVKAGFVASQKQNVKALVTYLKKTLLHNDILPFILIMLLYFILLVLHLCHNVFNTAI